MWSIRHWSKYFQLLWKHPLLKLRKWTLYWKYEILYSIFIHKMRLEIHVALFKCYFRPCQYCMLNKQEYNIVLIIVIFYLNPVMDMFLAIYMHFCKKKKDFFPYYNCIPLCGHNYSFCNCNFVDTENQNLEIDTFGYNLGQLNQLDNL